LEAIMKIKDYAYLFALDGAWRKKRAEKGHFYTDKSLKTREAVMRNYIVPLWGSYHPKRLTVKIIDLDMEGIASAFTNRHLTGGTRNRILGYLSEVYVWLIEEGKTRYNPVRDVIRCGSGPEKSRYALPTPDMLALFPKSHEALMRIWRTQRYIAAFLILRDTGLRPGELAALKWGDWDSEIKFFPVLRVIESGTPDREKGTKTGATKPAIITDQTAFEIELLRKRLRPKPEDYIFVNRKGIPYSPHRLCWNFKKAVERAGIGRPEWTPYFLRHTFNTRMLEVLDDKIVGRLMGHTTEEMRRHYRHADAESLAREASKIRDEVNAGRLY
jgi:integrase